MKISKFAALAGAVSGVVFASAALLAQQSKFPPRTPDGKPDLSGIYEWPKTDEGEKCKCSATIFDRNKFPPFKPGGEAFYEPRTAIRAMTNRATSASRRASLQVCCPPMRFASCRTRISW